LAGRRIIKVNVWEEPLSLIPLPKGLGNWRFGEAFKEGMGLRA